MLDFCPGLTTARTQRPLLKRLPSPTRARPRTSVADADAASFIVSLDRRGRIAYPGPTMTRRGKTSHLIAALTRRASADYLDYLRRTGVSYVFCGDDDINCAQFMEKLASLFGVKRASWPAAAASTGASLRPAAWTK